MKRNYLVGKSITFLVVFLAICLMLGVLGNRVASEYLFEHCRLSALEPLRDSVDVFSIGPSQSKNLDFPAVGVSGYSLYHGGADLYETLFRIDKLLPILSQSDLLLVPIHPLAFHSNNFLAERSVTRKHAYADLPLSESFSLIDHEFTTLVRYWFSFVSRADNWRGVYKAIVRSHRRRCDDIPLVLGLRPRAVTATTEEALLENELFFYEKHRGIVSATLEKNRNISSALYSEWEHVIHKVEDDGFHIVLFVIPMTPGYRVFLEQEKALTTEGYDLLGRLNSFSNVTVFDYSSVMDEKSNEWFSDYGHLTDEGASIFTKHFFKDLRNAGLYRTD